MLKRMLSIIHFHQWVQSVRFIGLEYQQICRLNLKAQITDNIQTIMTKLELRTKSDLWSRLWLFGYVIYLFLGFCFLVFVSWFLFLGFCFLVFVFWFLFLGFCFLVFVSWYLTVIWDLLIGIFPFISLKGFSNIVQRICENHFCRAFLMFLYSIE